MAYNQRRRIKGNNMTEIPSSAGYLVVEWMGGHTPERKGRWRLLEGASKCATRQGGDGRY